MYALIENNIVIQKQPNEGANGEWVECPDWVCCGVEVQDGEFLKPSPPSESQERINAKNRAYLASTDWYFIRSMETGVEMPTEILTRRAEARGAIL